MSLIAQIRLGEDNSGTKFGVEPDLSKKLVNNATLIFWDFDGVIKDSVEVKSQAYIKLVQPFGAEVVDRVRNHHEAHGGMSRFDKLPIYLEWAGLEPTQSRVSEFCDQFSKLVLQAVIEAPWVPGVEAYLRSNCDHKTFVLISATPQAELEEILLALDLTKCFATVFGAPTNKGDAVRMMLSKLSLDPHECLMVGDARADYQAAEANHVPFLLRKHTTNATVFANYSGPSVKDFAEL